MVADLAAAMAPLQPVVEHTAVRRDSTVPDGAGHPVAIITDDRVTGRSLGTPPGATAWTEIEVEPAEQGTPEMLDRIEQTLLSAGARRAKAWSKPGRVLADLMPPALPQPVAGKDAIAGEVVLAYLREQADAIRATLARARVCR